MASELQKIIYQFLSEHLVSAQVQRRFRFMADYLDDNIANKKISNAAPWLTDQYILDFWLDSSEQADNLGFKLYNNTINELFKL